MTFATVPFHGFRVPLLGVSEDATLDATLQECEACHARFDLLQMRLNPDGQFRCDKCTALNSKHFPSGGKTWKKP